MYTRKKLNYSLWAFITLFLAFYAGRPALFKSLANAQTNTQEKNKVTNKVTNKKTKKTKAQKGKRRVWRNKQGLITRVEKPRVPVSLRASDVIRVTEVTGNIKALSPLAVRWKIIRAGSVVPNGSLVVMDDGSSLKYDFFIRKASGWFGKQAYINIAKATNFRIHTQELRKIRLGEYYLPMIPAKEPDPPQTTPEMMGIKAVLAHIWNRVATFVANDPGGRGFAEKLAKKVDIDSSMGLRARKIKMLAPIHGAGVYAFDVPQAVKVIWQPPENTKIEKFKLYVWRTNVAKPTNNYKVVTGNRHTVFLDEDGSYYFQIKSIANDYVSAPHIAHFFTNKNPSGKVKRNLTEEDTELHLTAISPKIADSFVVKSEKAKVTFKWEQSPDLLDSDQYVVLTDRKTNTKREFNARGKSALTLQVPPGDFFWQVIAKFTTYEKNSKGELDETIQVFQGERRPLAIYNAKEVDKVLSDLFYLYRFQDTTVYLDEGL
jgi:hypothetical protein